MFDSTGKILPRKKYQRVLVLPNFAKFFKYIPQKIVWKNNIFALNQSQSLPKLDIFNFSHNLKSFLKNLE